MKNVSGDVTVNKIKQVSADMLPLPTREVLDRLSKYLPSDEEPVTFILKSHLILEKTLLDYVVEMGKGNDFFKRKNINNLKFSNLLRIAVALDFKGISPSFSKPSLMTIPSGIWETLYDLDRLRNSLAHDLNVTTAKLNGDIDVLIKNFYLRCMPELKDANLEKSYFVWYMNTILAFQMGQDEMFGPEGTLSKLTEDKL
jgi:hypothetical protein